MKNRILIWTVLALVISLQPVHADENSEAFYGQCIDIEIQHCRVKAERADSRSTHVREDAEKAKSQVEYYESYRDVLIQQMEEEGVSPIHHKVRRYMIDSYYQSRIALD